MLRFRNPLSQFLLTVNSSNGMSEFICAKHEKQHETGLKVALPLEHVLLEQ